MLLICPNKFIFLKQVPMDFVFNKNFFGAPADAGSCVGVSACSTSPPEADCVQPACTIINYQEISQRASSSSFTLKHSAHCATPAAHVHKKHSQLPQQLLSTHFLSSFLLLLHLKPRKCHKGEKRHKLSNLHAGIT